MERKKRTKGGGQIAISAKIDEEIWHDYFVFEENRNRLINECLRFWYYTKYLPSGRIAVLNGVIFKVESKQIFK